jgi:hypothetical protein
MKCLLRMGVRYGPSLVPGPLPAAARQTLTGSAHPFARRRNQRVTARLQASLDGGVELATEDRLFDAFNGDGTPPLSAELRRSMEYPPEENETSSRSASRIRSCRAESALFVPLIRRLSINDEARPAGGHASNRMAREGAHSLVAVRHSLT